MMINQTITSKPLVRRHPKAASSGQSTLLFYTYSHYFVRSMVTSFCVIASFLAMAVTAIAQNNGSSTACRRNDLSYEKEVKSRVSKKLEEPDAGEAIVVSTFVQVCCTEGKCPSVSFTNRTTSPSLSKCFVSSNIVQNDTIKRQFDTTNEHFAPARISFQIKQITRLSDSLCGNTTVEDRDATDKLRKAVRQGGFQALNILYMPTRPNPRSWGSCRIPQN